MEPLFIAQYNSCGLGYNITIGGEGVCCPKTDEWKQKISRSRKQSDSCKESSINNLKKANEANKNLPGANKGRIWSDEVKLKWSTIRKAKEYPNVTCPHCDKTGGQIPMQRWHFDNCKLK